MPNMAETIKQLAVKAVEEAGPAAVVFGVVVSAVPLRISIDQKLTLEEEHLILTNAVKTHTVRMSGDFSTELTKITTEHAHTDTDLATIETEHSHNITGTKTYTVYNGLAKGEKVILIRCQGGQQYIVLDRG